MLHLVLVGMHPSDLCNALERYQWQGYGLLRLLMGVLMDRTNKYMAGDNVRVLCDDVLYSVTEKQPTLWGDIVVHKSLVDYCQLILS